jgi:SAM-dependent methyltransferase
MPRDIDALTSSALKHVRDRWWSPAFTEFLRDNLQPRPGARLLDVGCGIGTAELALAPLAAHGIEIIGADLAMTRVAEARATAVVHGVASRFVAADATALPFKDGSVDATFCVGVLQHLARPVDALAEFARVTRSGGRVIAVEPDNRARYCFSALGAGMRAFELAQEFWREADRLAGDATDAVIGPHVPGLMLEAGIDPLAVHLFPVVVSRLGTPVEGVWRDRRQAVATAADSLAEPGLRNLAADVISVLDAYERAAAEAGPAFVEIQHTMLFATIGQRRGK